MSACGKHGGPVWFHCPKCRASAHDVEVLALVKTYNTKSPVRQSLSRWRYHCKCGHVGTSRHIDIERRHTRAKADKWLLEDTSRGEVLAWDRSP